MKIAVFQVTSSYAIGGSETYTWNLSRYLLARGHHCDLIAGFTDNPRRPFPEVPLLMAPFVRRERIWDLGTRFRKLVERLTFAWNARSLLLNGRYDIINIHKPYDIPAALWFRRQTGCRIIWRCHGTDFYPGLKYVIGRIDAIYCVSNFARDTLRKHYPVDPGVIYTGVDTRFFDPALEPTKSSTPPQILYFGRLEGWKGVRYLIEALGQLRQLDWHARIVGAGPERDGLAQQIASLGLAERVRIEEGVSGPERVRRLLAEADIVAFPSVGVETMSNALLEAMSMSKAVVATRVGGFPEVVRDGTNGLLVDPRNARALADAIERLLQTPELRRRLGAAARDTVASGFDAAASFRAVDALFEKALHAERR
jgi:glycosyltransferase involved in cell wall biosynthesis